MSVVRAVPAVRPDNVSRSWAMQRMQSRCPVPGLSAADRFDPFFDGLWEDGSAAVWTSRAVLERQDRAGFARVPKRMLMPPARAEQSLWSGRYRAEKLRFLAALDQWRTLTCEQAAAFAGTDTLLDVRATIPKAMWNLGLVDVGQFRGLAGYGFARRGWLFRPARTRAFEELVEPRLTWPEWLSVTAGSPWDPGGQFDRHNVLAAELGLRLAEFADIGTVLGEKLSKVGLLCGHMDAASEVVARGETKAADLTVVRPDGLRIAVELTANSSATFAKKVERWARILDSAPLAESGLVVVFVVAEPVGSSGGSTLRSLVAKRVAHGVRNFPGQVGDRVADRMFLTSWEEWFPAAKRVSPDFLSLRALSPSGPSGDLWREQFLLDPDSLEFRPSQPDAVTAVLRNAQGLAGVPWWIRHPEAAPSTRGMLLSSAGRDSVPAAPSAAGLPVGGACGVAGPVGVPERLRWL